MFDLKNLIKKNFFRLKLQKHHVLVQTKKVMIYFYKKIVNINQLLKYLSTKLNLKQQIYTDQVINYWVINDRVKSDRF